MNNIKRYINKFWITVTVLLCIVFVVLFTPIDIERIGTLRGILATVAGTVVIILGYVIRAIIFTSWRRGE